MKLALVLNRLPEENGLNWQQAKGFVTTATKSFQAAGQDFKNTSSQTAQTAIAASVNNWLQAHPVVFRIFNTTIWAIDHPVISFAVIVLIMATAFSIFKALNRVLEMVGLSLLKAPFKLMATGLKLGHLGGLGIQQEFMNKNISADINLAIPQNSPQRLVEISQRLQGLQKEQNELLQEAVKILTLDKN